jgi:hypothetical protein
MDRSENSKNIKEAMTRFLILLFLISVSTGLLAQTTIRAGSEVKVKGLVSAKGLVNNSDKLDVTEAQITFTGTNQTLSTTAPLAIQGIIVEGGGTKTLKGDWTVTSNLTLTQGTLTTLTGKIIYAGSTALSGSASSFITGVLYQRGTGTRFYPIGAGTTYMPMSLNDVKEGTIEIGVEGFTALANLTLPLDLSALASNRYWQVTPSGTYSGSGVSLYVPGSSIDAATKLVAVEAENTSGTAINLGGGASGDFVSSFIPATKPILTIGIAESVDLRIMDLITPFNADNVNDRLKIINIEYVFRNKVTLLDRWGVVVKEWTDFRNYDDPNNPNQDNFDFSKLGPGNYICVMQYQLTADSPEEKLTQMISVLKGN